MTRTTRTESDPANVYDASGTEAGAVAALAERLMPVHVEELHDDDGKPLSIRVYGHDDAGGSRLIETVDLEALRDRPRDIARTVQVDTQHALAAYADIHLDGDVSSLWGSVEEAKITIVFNDGVPGKPGWGDHRAELALKPSPEWTAWVNHNERPHSQEDFGYFLEEYLGHVIDPDGSTLLEVARTFQAHVGATFRRAYEGQSDTLSLTWEEQVDAKAGKSGQLEIPKNFTVRLRPFLGSEPLDVTGNFLFKVSGGQLSLAYRLLNVDDHKREAVERVLAWVAEATKLTAIEGVAPKARR